MKRRERDIVRHPQLPHRPERRRTGGPRGAPERRAALRAEAGVRLAAVDVELAHALAEGWASPLRGFMREHEYLQCLHFNSPRLPSGAVANMSLPIVLAVGDADKDRIEGAPGELLAILRRLKQYTSNMFLFLGMRGKLKNVAKHMGYSGSSPSKMKISFVEFSSRKSALACVEGINSAKIGGEVKILYI